MAKIYSDKGIHLIPAVSFLDMIRLESQARVILTDSGGVQKEAWFLKKPVVIMRSETEWVEIINHGNGVLADASSDSIEKSVEFFFIDNLELLLKSEKKRLYSQETSPMCLEDFNKMIDHSEEDSENGRLTEARDLKKDVQSWT